MALQIDMEKIIKFPEGPYELCTRVSRRVRQLMMGAEPVVEKDADDTPITIAMYEILEGYRTGLEEVDLSVSESSQSAVDGEEN